MEIFIKDTSMAASLKELEDRIARLSADDRTRFIEELIRSLDTGEVDDTERAWLETAEQRYQEYRAEMLSLKPANMVFKDAESKLR